ARASSRGPRRARPSSTPHARNARSDPRPGPIWHRAEALPVDLDRAAPPRAHRLLRGDVEEAELLELPCPLERADVTRPEPSGLDERGDLLLRVGVVACEEDVERLARDLSRGERRREVR